MNQIVPKTEASADKVVPTQIAHIVMHTSRLSKIASWYKTVLNAWPSFENENLCFLTFDEEHHRIAFVQIPGLQSRVDGAVGFHHVAFTYKSLNDMLVTWERLDKEGIRPYWVINHGPTTSMYYNDPDRNRVELQVDNFDTAEEGIEYCKSPEFLENPVGVDVDPADLLRRLRAGESDAELKKRPNIGPRGLSGIPMG